MPNVKPFSEWSSQNTSDPESQIKNYSDYVRSEYYKSGEYNQDIENGIVVGSRDLAQRFDLLRPDSTEEEVVGTLDSILYKPTENKSKDLEFVKDYYDIDKGDGDPEAVNKAQLLRTYRARLEVFPESATEYQDQVDQILNDNDLVTRARKAAVDRGDLAAVAYTDDGGYRQVRLGYGVSENDLRNKFDGLVASGAISPTDIPLLSDALTPFFNTTKNDYQRRQEFANFYTEQSKTDSDLEVGLQNAVAAKQRQQRVAEEGGVVTRLKEIGEGALAIAPEVIATGMMLASGDATMALSKVADKAIGYTQTKDEELRKSRLNQTSIVQKLMQNPAVRARFSEEEVSRYVGDMVVHEAGAKYNPEKPETGIVFDSMGVPVLSRDAFLIDKDFDAAVNAAKLSEQQKQEVATLRDAALKGSTSRLKSLIIDNDFAAVDLYRKAKAEGKDDTQFIKDYFNNPDNYSYFATRAKSVGLATARAISDPIAYTTLQLGNKYGGANSELSITSAIVLAEAAEDENSRREYAALFGDNIGFGQEVINMIPQIAADIAITKGAGMSAKLAMRGLQAGARTTVVPLAESVAKRLTMKSSLGLMGRAALESSETAMERTALAAAGEGAVSEALQQTGESFTKRMVNVFKDAAKTTSNAAEKLQLADRARIFALSAPAAFLRSGSTTYGSIYSQLPDTMSHEQKNEVALKYSIAAGAATALITGTMGAFGAGGLEEMATGGLASKAGVPLTQMTYRQFQLVVDNLRASIGKGALSNKAFQTALRKELTENTSRLFRSISSSGLHEGFEEMVDQAYQIKLEDAALDRKTPLADRLHQIFIAGAMGFIVGSGSHAITEARLSDAQRAQALSMRGALLSRIVDNVSKTNSPATLDVLKGALDKQMASDNVASKPNNHEPNGQMLFPFMRETPTTQTTPTQYVYRPMLNDLTDQTVKYKDQTGRIVVDDQTGEVTFEKGKYKVDKKNNYKLDSKGNRIFVPDTNFTPVNLGSRLQRAEAVDVNHRFKTLPITSEAVGNTPANTPYINNGNMKFAFPPKADTGEQPIRIVRNAEGKVVAVKVMGAVDMNPTTGVAATINHTITDPQMMRQAAAYYGIDLDAAPSKPAPTETAPAAEQMEFDFSAPKQKGVKRITGDVESARKRQEASRRRRGLPPVEEHTDEVKSKMTEEDRSLSNTLERMVNSGLITQDESNRILYSDNSEAELEATVARLLNSGIITPEEADQLVPDATKRAVVNSLVTSNVLTVAESKPETTGTRRVAKIVEALNNGVITREQADQVLAYLGETALDEAGASLAEIDPVSGITTDKDVLRLSELSDRIGQLNEEEQNEVNEIASGDNYQNVREIIEQIRDTAMAMPDGEAELRTKLLTKASEIEALLESVSAPVDEQTESEEPQKEAATPPPLPEPNTPAPVAPVDPQVYRARAKKLIREAANIIGGGYKPKAASIHEKLSATEVVEQVSFALAAGADVRIVADLAIEAQNFLGGENISNENSYAFAGLDKDGKYAVVIGHTILATKSAKAIAQVIMHETVHVGQYMFHDTKAGKALVGKIQQLFDPDSADYDQAFDELMRREYAGWDKLNLLGKVFEAGRASVEMMARGTLSRAELDNTFKNYLTKFFDYIKKIFNGNESMVAYAKGVQDILNGKVNENVKPQLKPKPAKMARQSAPNTVTPEMDSTYMAAVESGDMGTAKKIVHRAAAPVKTAIPESEGGNMPPSTWESLSESGYKPEAAEKTQITTTAATYEKIFNAFVKKGMKVLDFAAGRGAGTAAMKRLAKKLGVEVKGYEPYSNPITRVIAPEFDGMDSLSQIPDNSQDVVINNAVLNVVPEAAGKEIVKQIYSKLKPGGSAFINVMGWSNIKGRLANPKTKLVGPREVITSKGTFQKGYTFETLEALIREVVSDAQLTHTQFGDIGFRVTKPSEVISADVARHSELEAKYKAGTITDAEYVEAQAIVAKAAKAAGYSFEAYHYTASDEDFTVFSKERATDFGGWLFFTPKDRNISGRRGARPMGKFYLKLGNTLSRSATETVAGVGTPQSYITNEEASGFDSILGVEEGLRGEEISEVLVRDPSQIKSADPFTGVPLDQRFNPTSEDIRYALIATGKISQQDLNRHAELEAKYKAGTITPEETAEAEAIVAKAARAAGYEVASYHGTNGDLFTVFDLKMGGKKTFAESATMGVFSTDNPAVAWMYASNIGVFGQLEFSFDVDTPMVRARNAALETTEGRKLRGEVDKATDAVNEARQREFDKLKEKYASKLRVSREADGITTFSDSEIDALSSIMAQSAFVDLQEKSSLRSMIDADLKLTEAEQALGDYIMEAVYEAIPNRRVMSLFLKLQNPAVYDANGETPSTFALSPKIADAKIKGHDGVVFKNIVDPDEPATHYVVFNSNQIKSADPFTGVPLEERFNPASEDIRYAQPVEPQTVTLTTNPVPFLQQAVPAGMKLQSKANMRGTLGYSESTPDTIYYNAELLSNAIEGLSEDNARSYVRTLVGHEIGHAAGAMAMSEADYDSYAETLGADGLEKAADHYYSVAYPDPVRRAAAIKADRESGRLTDRTIAAEAWRMQIEKSISGRTSESHLRFLQKNPNMLEKFLDYLKRFAQRVAGLFNEQPSIGLAAAMSQSLRAHRYIMNGGFQLAETVTPDPVMAHHAEFYAALTEGSDQTSFSLKIASQSTVEEERFWSRVSKKFSQKVNDFADLPNGARKINDDRLATKRLVDAFAEKFFKNFSALVNIGKANGTLDLDVLRNSIGDSGSPFTKEVTEAIRKKVDEFADTLDEANMTEYEYNEAIFDKRKQLIKEAKAKYNGEALVRIEQAMQKLRDSGNGTLADLIENFRDQIDEMSLRLGYDESVGVYITRTYQFFRTKGFAEAARAGGTQTFNGVTYDFEALRAEAATAFADSVMRDAAEKNETLTADELGARTNERLDAFLSYLEQESKDGGLQTTNTIKLELERLMPKGQLDERLRALMGEVTDPLVNMLTTYRSVGMLAANEKFLNTMGNLLLSSGVGSRSKTPNTVIAFGGKSNPAYSTMAGIYVDPEVARALQAIVGRNGRAVMTNTDQTVNGFTRLFDKVISMSIVAKTLGSVGFYPRNAVSNQIVLMSSAGIPAYNRYFKTAYRYANIANRASVLGSPEEMAAVRRLIELGVVRDSAVRGQVNDFLKGFNESDRMVIDNLIDATLSGDSEKAEGLAGKIKNKIVKTKDGTIDFLQAMNGIIDDAAKTQVYMYELDVLKAAYANDATRSLDSLEREAASRMKKQMPTNASQLDITKALNRSVITKFVFPFARWKTEVLRTQVQSVQLSIEDLKSKNPVLMRRGAVRLASQIGTFFGASTALGGFYMGLYTIIGAAKGALGLGDDKEKEDENARNLSMQEINGLRPSLPAWQQAHKLYVRLSGNNLHITDMSSIIPQSIISDPFFLIAEDLSSGNKVDTGRLVSYVKDSFIGTQLGSGPLVDAFSGQDDYGNPIVVSGEGFWKSFGKLTTFLLDKTITPAVISKAIQGAKNPNQAFDTAIGEFTGSRVLIRKTEDIAVSGFRSLANDARNVTRLRYPISSNKNMSESNIEDAIVSAQDASNAVQAKATDFVMALNSTGMSTRDIYFAAKQANFSKNALNAARRGQNLRWTIDRDAAISIANKLRISEEQDPKERIDFILNALRKMPRVYDVDTGM